LSEKPEVAWAEVRGTGWVIKPLKLHTVNFLGYLLGIVSSAVIRVLQVPVSNLLIALLIDSLEYRVDEVLVIIFLPPGKYASLINRLPVKNMVIIDFLEAIVRDTLGTISDRSCANIAED
jgi:hypothetical protein